MGKKTKKTLVTSTQNALPVKAIENGIVVTDDNRYVKILEVIPVNFFLRSVSEQNGIFYSFQSLFKSGPANMQIFSLAKKTNISKHLEVLKQEMIAEESPNCRVMQAEYARLLMQEGRNGGVTRRFFIAFEHERSVSVLGRESLREIIGELNSTAQRITGCLRDCGNEVNELDNEQTMNVFYEILNRRRAESISFGKHKEKILDNYAKKTGMPNPYVPVQDLIAPAYIDFNSANYICIDGKYYTFAYIPTKGYNPVVIPGWTTSFVNAGLGIDVSMSYLRVPKEEVLFKIRQSITQNRASLMDSNDAQSNYESLNASVQAGTYIKEGLASGQDFYYLFTLISICEDSIRSCELVYNELKKFLNARDIKIKKASFEMESAFWSMLPVCKTAKGLWEKGKRNMITEGAASTYPFTAFEMSDENGIMIGKNLTNNSLAIVNIFNQNVYKNANMFIAGTTGAGKTFSLLLLAIRMRIKHIPVFIIAPEKEHEFERICNAMDGQFIRFGSGSPHCINIMDIRKIDTSVTEKIDGEGINSSRLAEKIQDLKTFFKLLVPDISYEEKELLDEALIRAYAKKGITMDNDSLIDPDFPDRYKEMPILGDLYDELLKDDRSRRVATIINMLVSGSGKSFNGHTNVNLDNEFVILGLEHLNKDLLPIGMFMAIDYVWSRIKEDRTKEKTLFIDEWWRFAFDPLAAEYSLQIAKTIRAYGGSLILATQQVSDIFAIENGKYGEGVINNCKLKIIMQLEDADADKVQEILKLTDTEKYKVTRFKRGEALLIANSNNVMIKFEANPTEFRLITTDREELRKQVQEKENSERSLTVLLDEDYNDVLVEMDEHIMDSEKNTEKHSPADKPDEEAPQIGSSFDPLDEQPVLFEEEFFLREYKSTKKR